VAVTNNNLSDEVKYGNIGFKEDCTDISLYRLGSLAVLRCGMYMYFANLLI
jgi:hypothetical protein